MRIEYSIIVLILLCAIWSIIEAQLYRVKKIELKSEKVNKDIKIIFISDLHYGDYYAHFRLKKIINSINSLAPDIIIIGGDYLDNNKKSKLNKRAIEKVFFLLNYLKAKNAIVSVLGNHEYYLRKNINLILEGIKENKIILLKNATKEVSLGTDRMRIHGVDDLLEGKVDIDKLKIDKEYLNIIVSHNPDFFEKYDIDFDIGLSGHTHGGQINLFGFYALVTESQYGQKYVKTINYKGKSIIITTKGLGCSALPIRFFAMPEIIELVIRNNIERSCKK